MRKKIFNRSLDVILNGIRSFLPSILSVLLSLLIIKLFSENLWGDFVKYNIYILSSGIIFSLGNKEFLLKEISKKPGDLKSLINESFISRLPLLLATVVIAFFFFPNYLFFPVAILLASNYICNSINIVLIYEKKYVKSIVIELLVFTVFVLLIVLLKPLDIYYLFCLYAIFFFLKAILYISFEQIFELTYFKFSISHLKKSIPFFLISIIGFINTKIDLFLIVYYEENSEIATYQVITSFFIMIQSCSIIMSLPFIKYIYRVKLESLAKIETSIRWYTPLFILSSLLIIYLIMENIYHFSYNILFYLSGFFIILPSYWLLIKYFLLYKNGKEILVSKISLISSIINFFLSFLLLKLGYGMLGVIIGSALAAISTIIMFYLIKNEKTIECK